MHQTICGMVEADGKWQNKQKIEPKSYDSARFFVHFVKNAGLSDWTWTSGLYHPKVARYQLRHTQEPDTKVL